MLQYPNEKKFKFSVILSDKKSLPEIWQCGVNDAFICVVIGISKQWQPA
jgi:hypothetical protein